MRCDERAVRRAELRRVVVVRRVESVCCAFTVDTPPNVRAIARPIAQLLENPIRMLSSHYAALRVQAPAGDLAGGASDPVGDFSLPTRRRWGSPSIAPPHRGTSLRPTSFCGRPKSMGGSADAGRAPSDDHRRGTRDRGILRAVASLNR